MKINELNWNYFVSLAFLNQEMTVPNNGFTRLVFKFFGGIKLFKSLTFGFNITREENVNINIE